jgi:DNA-binding response OmpR family regulator
VQHAYAFSPSMAIRELERQVAERDAEIDRLRARLELAGIVVTDAPAWLADLTPAQRRIMYALHIADPFEVDRWDLLAAMGGADPGLKTLTVQIVLIRDRLGTEAVETVPGVGYRLGRLLRKPQGEAP